MKTLFYGVTTMQEDALWVKQTLEGDEQAFHRLIMRYYTAIHALITSWVKNSEDAKDLAQEVFLKAYQEMDSLRHPEQFRIWLHQIARHQCQDWLRKKQETFVQLDEGMIYETPSADELLILQETLAKVMKAIDELPKSESQLLKERYLDDDSYDEIETRHGLSHSVLAMRLFRAREKVRESLKKVLAGIGILTFRYSAEDILTKGVIAVKMTIKAKIITAIVATSVILGGVGVIVWNSHIAFQETPTPEITKQSAQKTLTNPSVSLVSSKKSVSSKPIVAESAKIKEASILPELQEKENLAKATNAVENKKENKGKTISAEEEYNRKQFEEARAMYEIQAKEQIPIMVEKFKVMKAENKKQEERSDRTEAESAELHQKQLEMWDVQSQIVDLANKYDSTHREERAVFPGGWLAPYLKEVGIVYKDGPPVFPPGYTPPTPPR
jgi:RNA polymerase sigma factor (sigma-70 family)